MTDYRELMLEEQSDRTIEEQSEGDIVSFHNDNSVVFHDLKIKQKYLIDLLRGVKTFEIRFNDRDYKVGDVLRFHIPFSFTSYCFEVTDLFNDFGLQKGYVILSIKRF